MVFVAIFAKSFILDVYEYDSGIYLIFKVTNQEFVEADLGYFLLALHRQLITGTAPTRVAIKT